MRICVNGGHTPASPGAGMYLDEVTEDRRVKDALIGVLRNRCHEVIDCTADDWMEYPQELNTQVARANASGAELGISIHFNAGGGTGCEVLYHPDSAGGDGQDYAVAVSARMAYALGLRNRGAKQRNNLWWLNGTNMTAILVEVCFVDNEGDEAAYRSLGPDGVANAIADAIVGGTSPALAPTPSVPSNPQPARDVNIYARFRSGNEWQEEVVNFNNTDSNGFAGIGGVGCTGLMLRVDRGTIQYQAHEMGRPANEWLGIVTGYDANDYLNGWAGNGNVIDCIRAYYVTPDGERFQRVFYRSQRVGHEGYLAVVQDSNSIDGQGMAHLPYDDNCFAGIYGQALDIAQFAVAETNPF